MGDHCRSVLQWNDIFFFFEEMYKKVFGKYRTNNAMKLSIISSVNLHQNCTTKKLMIQKFNRSVCVCVYISIINQFGSQHYTKKFISSLTAKFPYENHNFCLAFKWVCPTTLFNDSVKNFDQKDDFELHGICVDIACFSTLNMIRIASKVQIYRNNITKQRIWRFKTLSF